MDEQDREDDIRQHVCERVEHVTLAGHHLDTDNAHRKLNGVLPHVSRKRKGEIHANLERDRLNRRDFLKLLGVTSLGAAAALGFTPFLERFVGTKTHPTGYAHENVDIKGGSIDVSQGNGYEIWNPSGQVTVDLPDDVTVSNVLINQDANNAVSFRSRENQGWTIKNIGWKGTTTSKDGGGDIAYLGRLGVASSGTGTVENVFMEGWGTKMGGLWTRPGHQGKLVIKNSYFAGFGNNAVYGSNHAENSPKDGRIFIDSSYARDNTTGNFRIGGSNGSETSTVSNSMVVINDPDCNRGSYFDGSHNARPIWARWGDGRAVNCVVYVDPEDCQGSNGAYQASQGGTLYVENSHVNADAPNKTKGDVQIQGGLGNDMTVPLMGGGVPTSPEEAAAGQRGTPSTSVLTGEASESPSSVGSGTSDTSTTNRDSNDAGSESNLC